MTTPAPLRAATEHFLKTDPEVFRAVWDGLKTFEIRFNDRDFKVGDYLCLRETTFTGDEIKAGAPLEYTGRTTTRTVSHVLTGYGLAPGWCCLSFAPAPVAPEGWISVEDRMPPKSRRVLAYFPKESSSVMDGIWDGERFMVNGYDRTHVVTHWHELPAPPTGEAK